jgi:hypothetical protein
VLVKSKAQHVLQHLALARGQGGEAVDGTTIRRALRRYTATVGLDDGSGKRKVRANATMTTATSIHRIASP